MRKVFITLISLLCIGTSYASDDGYYWFRSLYSDYSYGAWYLYFNLGYVDADNAGNRCYGRSVRAVRVQN